MLHKKHGGGGVRASNVDKEVGKINLCDSATHLEQRVCLHMTEEISVTFGITVRMQIMILSREPEV